MSYVKLSVWAESNGVSRQTAYRWFREGAMPVHAYMAGPKTILVKVEDKNVESKHCVIYARVSSHDQKSDLDRQVARLASWATEQKMPIVGVVTEIGSGMNGSRPKLTKLLKNSEVTSIVVERKDRLGRMNVELVEAALHAQGRSVIVVDRSELDDDLVTDMVEVLTSFCARLYGKRSAKNRAARALAAAKDGGSGV